LNEHLAVQLSGSVIQAVADGLQASHDAQLPLFDYWSGLSIATASSNDETLDFIGALAGYPRPIVPINFFSPNMLRLSAASLWRQSSNLTGLGSVYFPEMGGQLGSVFPSAEYQMPDGWYRALIPLASQLKYYGLTLYTIDLLADFAQTTYAIAFHATVGPDIDLTFGTDVGYPTMWILQDLFDRYATGTQVNVVNGVSSLFIAITEGVRSEDLTGFDGAMVGAIDQVSANESVTVLKDMMRPQSQDVAVRESVTVARG
jgi:hypothetical protein